VNARSSGLCDARLEPCACRKPKSGRIGDAARQAGRATRCARFAGQGERPTHPDPMTGAFSLYCNSEHVVTRGRAPRHCAALSAPAAGSRRAPRRPPVELNLRWGNRLGVLVDDRGRGHHEPSPSPIFARGRRRCRSPGHVARRELVATSKVDELCSNTG
jgi:hypothetical protein